MSAEAPVRDRRVPPIAKIVIVTAVLALLIAGGAGIYLAVRGGSSDPLMGIPPETLAEQGIDLKAAPKDAPVQFSTEVAESVALKNHPEARVREIALRQMTSTTTAASRIVWAVNFEPEPAGSKESEHVVAFVDAATAEYLFSIAYSTAK